MLVYFHFKIGAISENSNVFVINVWHIMSLISGCSEVSSEDEFYDKALDYWKAIPSTLNGMLGGYGHICNIDVRGSQSFLKYFTQVGSL